MNSTYWTKVLARRISRRRTLIGAGSTAFGAAMLVACGGGDGGSTLKLDDAAVAREPGTVWFSKNNWRLADEIKQAVRGGTYRSVMTSDQEGHYDAMILQGSQVPFSNHVHEMLMHRAGGPGIDPKSIEAATPVPGLAQSWEISADGMTVTFTLRPNVKWHPIPPVNGRVMDMEDWRSTHERYIAVGAYRNDLLGPLDRAEFPDSTHMVWKLKFPYAPLFGRIWTDKFTWQAMPKELNANPGLAERTAIGTGYKILDNHQRAITMEYRKHPEYWGGDPFIDRWHAPIVPEYSNRYAQFVNGNITDFTPTARDVLTVAKDVTGAVVIANEPADDYVLRMRFGRINPERYPWADPRVRIAIRRAANFKGIGEFRAQKAAFEAAGIPIDVTAMTHLPHNPTFWLDPEKEELGKLSANYLYDPAEARKLLAAAGHQAPLELPFAILAQQGTASEDDQLLIDSWEQSGVIKPSVSRSASSTEFANFRIYGQMEKGGLAGPSSSSNEVDYIVYLDYSTAPGLISPIPYPDARSDALADSQRRETDIAKRAQVLKDFQSLQAELMMTIPGHHLFTNFSMRWPWLHNSNYGEGGSPPSGRPIAGGHLHWLDTAMPNRDKRI